MSSDSDQDSFFDAADETPFDSFSHPSSHSSPKNFTLSQIEEEERRLLHLKRIADERRRQEDEELERRLSQLQQRKRVECDSMVRGGDPSTMEHEGRRKKLEEMRQSLGADRSTCSISTSHDSSVDNDSPNTSTDIPDVFSMSGVGAAVAVSAINSPTTTKSHTIEKMENNGVQGTPSHKHHAKKRSGSWGDLPKNDPSSITVASLAAEFTRNMQMISAGGLCADEEARAFGSGAALGAGRGDRSGGRSSDTLSSGEGGLSDGSEAARAKEKKLSDMSLNMERYQPEKEKQNKSLTLLISGSKLCKKELSTDSVVDTILQQTQVQDEDCEPDIVKSTKSQRNTPPSTLKQPVAPPRRKKSTRNPPEAINLSPQTESLPVPPSPLFYHREPPSPKLGRESTLDVKSALEGSRFILTENAENVPSTSSHASSLEDRRPSPGSLERFSALGKSSSSPTRSPSIRRSASAASSSSTSSHHHRHIPPTATTTNPGNNNLGSQHSTIDNASAGLDTLSAQIQHWQSMGDGEKEASPSRRPRSSSGRILSDEEILELVTVRNLDTGETIPLSSAEDKLPKCVNPLSLHIMKRIKEYASDTSLHVEDVSDQSDSKSEKSVASSSNNIRLKRKKLSKFFGKTVNRVKNVADQALHSEQMPVEEEVSVDGKVFKIKSASRNKGPYDFSQPYLLQEMSGEHRGAIWTMKFSPCGKLLATGGQDSILRIWVLKSTYSYFEDFRQKYSDVRLSPAVSHESLNSASSDMSASAAMDPLKELNRQSEEDDINAPFRQRPFCVYKGHTADLLDLSWSKNYFILSSSMDKTVRLWHISRRECLCTFQHIDFVTAIVFHPKDDRYFLSGSLDGKLRLWNIPDKKVTMWNELSGASNLITAANFCYNGRLAVVGTYDGKCIFYTTDQLKYYTMLNVRSSRGKNSKGRKITGIEVMPGEDKILVTSNDSRIRLYNLKDCTLSCKYKGCMNNSSQIRASFSSTGKYVICGSEDHFLYVWKTHHEFLKFTSARRDRNIYWEAIKIHNAIVTSAIFAPNPSFIFRMAEQESMGCTGKPLFLEDDMEEREIIVTADFTGAMKIMTNRSYRIA